ncbi:MAG: hypothetical protein PHX18_00215 [Candidatus Gastranaerophilales bacterium]|nr:hypothetical protein [Candidatus Gastranaerophilales bacterium]
MINWNEIYTKYLQGAAPKDLAVEYGVEAKKISAKVSYEKWKEKKIKIKDKIIDSIEKKIEKLTQSAFDELEKILNSEDAAHTNKIQAAKAIIDVSGLKKDKKELSASLSYEVYINRESVK